MTNQPGTTTTACSDLVKMHKEEEVADTIRRKKKHPPAIDYEDLKGLSKYQLQVLLQFIELRQLPLVCRGDWPPLHPGCSGMELAKNWTMVAMDTESKGSALVTGVSGVLHYWKICKGLMEVELKKDEGIKIELVSSSTCRGRKGPCGSEPFAGQNYFMAFTYINKKQYVELLSPWAPKVFCPLVNIIDTTLRPFAGAQCEFDAELSFEKTMFRTISPMPMMRSWFEYLKSIPEAENSDYRDYEGFEWYLDWHTNTWLAKKLNDDTYGDIYLPKLEDAAQYDTAQGAALQNFNSRVAQEQSSSPDSPGDDEIDPRPAPAVEKEANKKKGKKKKGKTTRY
ncbi:unnamed protein product [Vitrella brassicaformis CCMP3155]|uniref:Uncharacterized protein n=1 Tax=Vitrella brassicaformis (strain CCMP3155) TaxID=1169540 RepID=A0A0G4GXB4_VITBC|nr:unnamed protein product [Vitrella brassicaformis CCMP3155]|eukprot:CEM35426.1 unnamed protein product [Vitrella brassicaformis CCMP3155]